MFPVRQTRKQLTLRTVGRQQRLLRQARAFQVKAMVEAKCKFAHIVVTEAGGITTVYAYDGGIVVAY